MDVTLFPVQRIFSDLPANYQRRDIGRLFKSRGGVLAAELKKDEAREQCGRLEKGEDT